MPEVCIHGHFYQPPREDPWSGVIPTQVSAHPFSNWNQRIAAECYRPNGQSAILDQDAQVARRVNNYKYISFNFGPTLLRWLMQHEPETVAALVEADRHSLARLGHGNAMAQAYHHSILPLANEQDKKTEIHWGIEDFRHRFGRDPEGMWVAETAVDTPTLEALAAAGIRFVVLAPRQAANTRQRGTSRWVPTSVRAVDPGRPYRIPLPSGAEISAFFYDSGPAQGVAFGGWLHNGERMAHRLNRMKGPLVHLATDGESYGHHHRHGEMALTYCLAVLRDKLGVTITNYATVLAENPPTYEATIHENSSWSCSHGVGRWSENCGCAIDPALSGTHEWRRVLRAAMNDLRDELATFYVARMSRFGESPWTFRDRYISHILARESKSDSSGAFLEMIGEERIEAERLLEMQRNALMMFTSCGWFFDDPAGLEATQIVRYAHRAISLHRTLGGMDLMGHFENLCAPLLKE